MREVSDNQEENEGENGEEENNNECRGSFVFRYLRDGARHNHDRHHNEQDELQDFEHQFKELKSAF